MAPLPASLAPLKSRIRLMLTCASFVAAVLPLAAQMPVAQTAVLPGHVLGILPKATHLPRNPERGNDQVTIEIVLRVTDEGGFMSFSQELEDPNSPNFHKPIQPEEFTARFGPTQEAYDKVLDYLEKSGFTLAVGSNNRRTLTVRGTRAQAERAFHVSIDDYQLVDRKFHAVASDPSLPAEIAPLVLSIGGLSNLARWQPAHSPTPPTPATPASIATAYTANLTNAGLTNSGGLPPGLNGSGRTIGIIGFYDFHMSDISNWLSYAGLPPSLIDNIHKFSVDGGASTPHDEQEPVLDVDAVLGIAPGANIVVYGGPWGDDAPNFYTLINAAIDNVGFGGTLTDSYLLCENEVTAADANSMDSLLQSAAASGITMFVAAGDFGGSCFSGSAFYSNTISYPSDAPHAVAVGGTTLNVNSDNSCKSESWWINAGGYGNSIYTSALGEPGTDRSVPDVSLDADSRTGMVICLATATKDPNCFGVGGTSMATPMWAGIWSLVNEANSDAGSSPFSAANGFFTSVPNAFHSPLTMTGEGNDTAHLGMGTPKVTDLVSIAGPPLSAFSVSPDFGTAAGGTTVTVKGQGFIGANKATFGGVNGSHVTIYSDSKLTVESPAAPDSQVDIAVQTPAGTSPSIGGDLFHYVPELKGVSPNQGPLTGGNSVTVTGVALSSGHGFEYSFGGVPATAVSCSSSTSCTMNVPAHGLGSVSLKIETPYGNSPTTVPYTYGVPFISSFSPSVGPTTGGLGITIYGANLASGMTVLFGDIAVTSGVSCDPTTCWVASPAHGIGSVQLKATVDVITSAPSAGKFTFKVFPTVTAVNPASAKSGTVLTLTGTGFSTKAGQTSFSFFGNPLAGKCTSATQCTVIAPGLPEGSSEPFTAVYVTVNGLTSMDWVEFVSADPPGIPPCKGVTCN